jgi:putative phosphoribosyl transferase
MVLKPAPSSCDALRPMVDECVWVIAPDPFHAVGAWYEDFSQTTDEEVRDLLERADVETMTSAAGR